MGTVTLSPDVWKRWAMYFTILFICVHSEPFGSPYGHNFQPERLKHHSVTSASADEKWIEQPLDHFNASDTRTFKMRYFERLDIWKENGPVYLYIISTQRADDFYTYNGIMAVLANETDGAMYVTEHRYNGKSMPFKNLTTENLAWLSSKQALADIANLVKQIKSDSRFTSSKVVVIGGAYGGNLATWFRKLYPDLADAAIASSAPVLAKKDFYEYFETVGDDYKKYGSQECYSKINDTFHRYERLFQTSEGQKQLRKELEICDSTDLNNDLNRQTVFLVLIEWNLAGYAERGTPEEIKNICENNITLNLHGMSNYKDIFWNEGSNCYDYRFAAYAQLSSINIFKTWLYQSCTEFGYFATTTSGNHPFTNNIHVNFYTSLCKAIFGPEFNEKRIDEGIKKTNEMYGGLQPNVSHVVFSNGDMDPYHRLGIVKDLSPDAPATLISGASRCSDLRPDRHSPVVIEARNFEKKNIKTWIGAKKEKTIEFIMRRCK